MTLRRRGQPKRQPELNFLPGSSVLKLAHRLALLGLGLLSSIWVVASCSSAPEHRGDSYLQTKHWHYYQRFLPDSMRFTADNLPKEEYWNWKGHRIHIDRYGNDASSCKVLLLHGGGGNGRVLGPIAVLVFDMGCTVVAPDMPGYGLSVPDPESSVEYSVWVNLVSDLMDRERRDGQKLYVFGLSIGGMLAYQSVARNGQADGLIVTTLADVRSQEARDAVSANLFLARTGVPLAWFFQWFIDGLHLPIASLSKMHLITNDPDFSEIFATDPHAGGGNVSMKFLRTFMTYNPALEPEDFTICPVLMIHPGLDPWTPLELSKDFFDRIAAKKELVILEGAGHLPYEEPGRTQMVRALRSFLSQ